MATSTHEEQLYKIFNNVNDWLKFAEAKNFGLLSINAAVILGFLQIPFAENSNYEKVSNWIIPIFTFLSFFPSFLSLFPIVSRIEKREMIRSWIDTFSNWIDAETKFENIHFYGYLKDIDDVEFQKKFIEKKELNVTTDKFNQFEIELVSQILYNSRITWLKYQLFKIGAFVFLFGIVVLYPLILLIIKLFS